MAWDLQTNGDYGYLKCNGYYVHICNNEPMIDRIPTSFTLKKLVLYRNDIILKKDKKTRIHYTRDQKGRVVFSLDMNNERYVLFHEYGHLYFGKCDDESIYWYIKRANKNKFALYTRIDNDIYYVMKDNNQLSLDMSIKDHYLFNFEIIKKKGDKSGNENKYSGQIANNKLFLLFAKHGWKMMIPIFVLLLVFIIYRRPKKKMDESPQDLDHLFLRKLQDEL